MIVIIDYGVGNLASVKNALDKLGAESKISSDPLMIKKAKALILPGVGAAGQGMKNLKKLEILYRLNLENRSKLNIVVQLL